MADYIEKQAAIDAAADFGKFSVEAAIEAIPAADVAPVVHAKWEAKAMFFPGQYECSNCGAILHRTIYCPNCGARMDGGDNDA